MSSPKFSEVLRAYAKGLTQRYDARFENLQPGVMYGYSTSPEERKSEEQARCTRAALEELAKLYEIHEGVAP